MGIENLLAAGVRARPAGMEQNALMQGQEMRQRQMQNALMQMNMQAAIEQRAQAQQAAEQQAQWRNALQVPQGEQFLQPGRPAMNAAQAESAAGTPGYGMSSAQDQMRMGPPDQKQLQAVQMARAGLMSPMDLFKIQNPERKTASAAAGSMIYDERTGQMIAQVPDKAATDTADWKDYQKALTQGYKGQFIDYQREMANLKAPKGPTIVNDINGGQKGFENEAKLRGEFDNLPEVKNYKMAFTAYAAVKDAASRNTPQSDINLVYGLAKLYDPTSVVREGEYDTIARSQSIPEWLKGWAQRIAGGGKLTPETKAQILTEAEGRIGSYESEYSKARTTYEGISRKWGFDPQNVFANIGAAGQPKAAPAAKGKLSADEQAELAQLRARFKGK